MQNNDDVCVKRIKHLDGRQMEVPKFSGQLFPNNVYVNSTDIEDVLTVSVSL